jgi:uncharacterized protein (TIGR03435 family)
MLGHPLRTAGALVLLALAAYAQVPAVPQFEVASIKPSLGPQERRAQKIPIPANTTDPGTYQVYMPLASLIRKAYRLEADQKLTGPDWLTTQYFEVAARLPQGATQAQTPEMLQALLAERFKLALHKVSKEEEVYLLKVGKDGPKLKEAAADAGPASKWVPKADGQQRLMVIGTANGSMVYSRLNGVVYFDASKISLPELASRLKVEVEAPVIDKTGLTGFYAVSMAVPALWLRASAPRAFATDGAVDASEPVGAGISTSLDSLGLKLEKGKATFEHYVVDHAEKIPTEN